MRWETAAYPLRTARWDVYLPCIEILERLRAEFGTLTLGGFVRVVVAFGR
ncbi:hypothetical protein RRSWK_01349 [Rhodopirellula sp. SWK7]|nr:hypothetical protein RRSWK_01349 [Rhodopirellula sp. SWK7]